MAALTQSLSSRLTQSRSVTYTGKSRYYGMVTVNSRGGLYHLLAPWENHREYRALVELWGWWRQLDIQLLTVVSPAQAKQEGLDRFSAEDIHAASTDAAVLGGEIYLSLYANVRKWSPSIKWVISYLSRGVSLIMRPGQNWILSAEESSLLLFISNLTVSTGNKTWHEFLFFSPHVLITSCSEIWWL